MVDFCKVWVKKTKNGFEIRPKFITTSHSDLMIRGGDFYAFWDEERGLWSTNESELFVLIDRALDQYVQENKDKYDGYVSVLHMWDSDSGMVKKWHSYCQSDLRDSYHMLDSKLTFSNETPTREDYVSKKLPYPLEKGTVKSYDRLMSVLYSPKERKKLEWAIGSIIDGDSKVNQKFVVLYGAPKTGKSTVLNIIEKLFSGYWSSFDAKALGSASAQFALEPFRTNPLVGIQHDGDLSRIEDNTRLNSLVAHEEVIVNEKNKSQYGARFNTFLFMGTNKPVKITDAKSGIIRRLIDVSPTGEKLPAREYSQLFKNIDFELGAIAYHCREVYRKNKDIYDEYIPTAMLGASNDFYNFVDENYFIFKRDDCVTLNVAWEMYKNYCDSARVPHVLPQRIFKEELKNYFKEFKERAVMADGSRPRNLYSGFRADRFEPQEEEPSEPVKQESWLKFDKTSSLFDILCGECPAQYASKKESPLNEWDRVLTSLCELDTTKLHYVRVPENHIVIDFDIPDENGNKCFEKNLEAASEWPETYAELSKSGQGIHLHYIYAGDPSRLSSKYADHVEVKVFTGKSSLRRKLTKCNDIPVATISSGLPLKGEKKTVNFEAVKSEKGLRSLIIRNLNKEIHPGTKPSVEFIKTILDGAYASGLKYDISDMRTAVMAFAMASTHHKEYCVKLVSQMKFSSEEKIAETIPTDDNEPLIFYDVEVFPNLFLVNWKWEGEKNLVVRMINPTPMEIEELLSHKLIGFNCRRYDNHILYARMLGYSNEQLYNLSQSMIVNGTGFFREAYNLSYTDVYDFSSKKQSLKKFEIELGIHHQELGYSWDEPVPEELWQKVAEYCDNDVLATEAVFNARKADFTAREILAALAGMTVNDTTNSLTAAIIFGKNNRRPQNAFNYRNMGDTSQIASGEGFNVFDKEGRPIFPGYLYDHGVSTYRGVEVGEGGRVYAEPGMYHNVALLDIASMHPSSIVAERLFGSDYTSRFQDILSARIAIKHGDLDRARGMLGGALAPYLTDPSIAKDLAQALKIVINSVYGLTAANFDNPFRDIRNVDNIVAKRGALFMVNLQNEVQERGFTVAHIKTDSIKIPDATPEIIQFVMDYGKKYGYNFEHEATYEKMCLVNDAVYIAKEKDGEWTATGTQFQVPYVFKTLFSHEPIEFDDMCETKAVSTALYIQFDQEAIDILKDIVGPEELERMKQIPMFVGRIGRFCPMKPRTGGGTLLRMSKDKDGHVKYGAVVGTKGYYWMESEVVKNLGKEKDIDESYYISLVDEARETISKYGDFEKFVSDDKEKEWDFMNLPEGPDEIPFDI